MMMFKNIFLFSFIVIAWGYNYPFHSRWEGKILKGEEYPFHSRWEDKIVGGTEARIEDFPYQVSLQYITTHICGGSIISTDKILTAAHCVFGLRPSSLTIYCGTKSINDIHDPGQRYFIDKIIIHENYNTTSHDYDVAILKLNRKIKFTNKVKPTDLVAAGIQIPPLTPANITGWGATEEGGHVSHTPSILRKAKVSVMHHNTCVGRYGTLITVRMLCAQSPGKDSCQGDSGGPLVWNNQQIGIVSWGYGCARPEYPGVYTNVTIVRSWIDEHINL